MAQHRATPSGYDSTGEEDSSKRSLTHRNTGCMSAPPRRDGSPSRRVAQGPAMNSTRRGSSRPNTSPDVIRYRAYGHNTPPSYIPGRSSGCARENSSRRSANLRIQTLTREARRSSPGHLGNPSRRTSPGITYHRAMGPSTPPPQVTARRDAEAAAFDVVDTPEDRVGRVYRRTPHPNFRLTPRHAAYPRHINEDESFEDLTTPVRPRRASEPESFEEFLSPMCPFQQYPMVETEKSSRVENGPVRVPKKYRKSPHPFKLGIRDRTEMFTPEDTPTPEKRDTPHFNYSPCHVQKVTGGSGPSPSPRAAFHEDSDGSSGGSRSSIDELEAYLYGSTRTPVSDVNCSPRSRSSTRSPGSNPRSIPTTPRRIHPCIMETPFTDYRPFRRNYVQNGDGTWTYKKPHLSPIRLIFDSEEEDVDSSPYHLGNRSPRASPAVDDEEDEVFYDCTSGSEYDEDRRPDPPVLKREDRNSNKNRKQSTEFFTPTTPTRQRACSAHYGSGISVAYCASRRNSPSDGCGLIESQRTSKSPNQSSRSLNSYFQSPVHRF